MEFPGLLGIGLHRLRLWMQRAPVAAMGPFLGIIAADAAIDIAWGRLGSVGVELLIAPIMGLTITFVAQRSHPGASGMMMIVLGLVSAIGAAMILPLAIGHGSAVLLIIGLRHLTVATYAWASIASEPPPRVRRLRLVPIPA